MPNTTAAAGRRAVILPAKAPAELAKALTVAGLEVRADGDPCAPDVLLADPLTVAASHGSLENVIAARAGELLAKLGDGVDELHDAMMSQIERGLLKAVLGHTKNHLGRASKILGLDRNTLARKARAFGLVVEPSRGRKPKAKPATGTHRRKAGKRR
jgi:DNA-binding protein Fis